MTPGNRQREQVSPVDAEPSEQELENLKHQRVSVGLPAIEETEQDDDPRRREEDDF